MAKKLRIVGYARVSTQRQAIEGFNLDGQIRQIKNYVDIYYENYDLTILREDGQSAKTMDRPEMVKIISMIKNHEMDVLVIYTYDRLTRRLKDFIDFLELLDRNGVVLDSMREKFDTSTASGRFMAHMISAMAEWEEDTISERTVRGLREAALKGNFIRGGAAPFGYKRDPENKHTLIIDEARAQSVVEVFQAAIDHIPLLVLANLFDAEKRNGFSNWGSTGRIYKIIANKLYYGVMTMGNEEFEVDIPHIISKEEFDEANKNHIFRDRYTSHDYLYKGFIFCKKCNSRLSASGTYKHSNEKYYRYYRCPNCKTIISETCVDSQVEKVFSQKEQEVQFIYYCQRAARRNVQYAQELQRLTMNELFELPESFIEEKSKTIHMKQTDLTENIKNLCTSLRRINFDLKSFSEKRLFLTQYVSCLKVDFRVTTPQVFVVWKSNKESEKTKNLIKSLKR